MNEILNLFHQKHEHPQNPTSRTLNNNSQNAFEAPDNSWINLNLNLNLCSYHHVHTCWISVFAFYNENETVQSQNYVAGHGGGRRVALLDLNYI